MAVRHFQAGVVFPLLAIFSACVAIAADAPAHDHAPAVGGEVRCVPVSERAGKRLGCYVLAKRELGKLPETPLYWHLHTYATREAAEAAKGKDGTVVQSFDQVWLLSVADDSWQPAGGKRVARVGPLPISHTGSYAAEYMEATFMPGMKSAAHRHPGPEAWYVIAGEQCLETPGKGTVVRAGESGIVPEGPPMILWGTGTAERRSLVLILHVATTPMPLPASDWKSEGRCHP
jgi:quercetin dioxygenase-like cupin family protein